MRSRISFATSAVGPKTSSLARSAVIWSSRTTARRRSARRRVAASATVTSRPSTSSRSARFSLASWRSDAGRPATEATVARATSRLGARGRDLAPQERIGEDVQVARGALEITPCDSRAREVEPRQEVMARGPRAVEIAAGLPLHRAGTCQRTLREHDRRLGAPGRPRRAIHGRLTGLRLRRIRGLPRRRQRREDLRLESLPDRAFLVDRCIELAPRLCDPRGEGFVRQPGDPLGRDTSSLRVVLGRCDPLLGPRDACGCGVRLLAHPHCLGAEPLDCPDRAQGEVVEPQHPRLLGLVE